MVEYLNKICCKFTTESVTEKSLKIGKIFGEVMGKSLVSCFLTHIVDQWMSRSPRWHRYCRGSNFKNPRQLRHRVLPRDAMLERYMLSCVCSSVRPSVCLSQAGVVSKPMVSEKLRILPSGTLSQTPDFENFATISRSCCQQNSSSSSTVEFADNTYTTIDESWLFITSRSTVTL